MRFSFTMQTTRQPHNISKLSADPGPHPVLPCPGLQPASHGKSLQIDMRQPLGHLNQSTSPECSMDSTQRDSLCSETSACEPACARGTTFGGAEGGVLWRGRYGRCPAVQAKAHAALAARAKVHLEEPRLHRLRIANAIPVLKSASAAEPRPR